MQFISQPINPILKDKIKKKLLKTINEPKTKKNIWSVGELVKPMNQVTRASTSNL
jgi:hypothetical protein